MSKVQAVVLNVPGAPGVWHMVPGIGGLFHPNVPVPDDDSRAKEFISAHKQTQADAKKAWDEFEDGRPSRHGIYQDSPDRARSEFPDTPCPLKLVNVTEGQANKGREAQAEALTVARGGVRALKAAGDAEYVLGVNQAAAVAGEE